METTYQLELTYAELQLLMQSLAELKQNASVHKIILTDDEDFKSVAHKIRKLVMK